VKIPWSYSLIEQITNTSLGLFIGALFLIMVINPLFSLSLSVIVSIEVSLIMFFVSTIRGLLIRRLWIRFVEERQSLRHSFVEKLIDVGLGLVIATIVWSFFVMPAYDVQTTFLVDVIINLMFFVINLLRSVFVRRVFENYSKKYLTGTPETV
jgi:FlaA1/EpsC-like NDP-sugar epimerase